MNYSKETPTEPGYYFVNNGYMDLVAQVYESKGELVYMLLPSIVCKQSRLRDVRADLLWCRVYPPNASDQRAASAAPLDQLVGRSHASSAKTIPNAT